MGRGMTIAVLCATGVGSVGGGLIALHVSPESSITQPIAPPAPAPRPAIVAQPITPDPHAALVVQLRAVLGRAAEWARAHTGEPCPDLAALGIAGIDPWGHKIELTCTDQPADQIIGAISAGPDGIPGNHDDVESWNLGPTVTQLVQGRRWESPSAAALTTKPPSAKRRKDSTNDRKSRPSMSTMKPSAQPAEPSVAPAPAPRTEAGDGIPTRR
jgi:hypothetical protein